MNLNNILIFGDSYSTHKEGIPDGFWCYYSADTEDMPNKMEMQRTWWKQLVDKTGSTLVQNNSWSGSTIGHTSYDGIDTSDTHCFLKRLTNLENEGFFDKNTINTVLIFGGTNDNWSQAPLGDVMFEGWTKADLDTVLPAICCFIYRVKQNVPNARVIFILNTEFKKHLAQGIHLACEHYGIDLIELENIDKMHGHPTELGMDQIAEQIISYLNK